MAPQNSEVGSEGSGQLPRRPREIRATELAALAASLPGSSQPAETVAGLAVTGISSNSALVRPGDLFAALPGAHGHGASYVPQAKADGAVAVLTDTAGEPAARAAGLPVLVCADPRAVLGRVSAEIYGNPSESLRVLGVTGTSGKTTTTSLVRAGLIAAGLPNGAIGTLGVFVDADAIKTPFTTPEAPQLQALLAVMRERGVDAVAMEVSSHALALGRADGIRFEAGAFTNLSQDHLDFHADMQDYFRAKSLLFDGRAAHELIVIDDDWGRRLIGPNRVTISTGPATDSDWRAEDIAVAADGSTSFTAVGPELEIRTGCRIPGSFNVANALLALALLSTLELDVAALAPAVALAQVPGRMQRVEQGQPWLVVVDYSHKPAGVSAALHTLRPLTRGRLLIVLGCGGDRDRSKRPVMGEVAARLADVLIVTDDNPRTEDPGAIRAAMLEGARLVPASQSAQVLELGDRRAAIERALQLAAPGDTVLIAGKGHETGQEIGGTMLAFDDVTVAATAMKAVGYDVAGVA